MCPSACKSLKSPVERAAKIAKLNSMSGYGSIFKAPAIRISDDPTPIPAHLLEVHHPLQSILEHYPMAVKIGLRTMGDLLGC